MTAKEAAESIGEKTVVLTRSVAKVLSGGDPVKEKAISMILSIANPTVLIMIFMVISGPIKDRINGFTDPAEVVMQLEKVSKNLSMVTDQISEVSEQVSINSAQIQMNAQSNKIHASMPAHAEAENRIEKIIDKQTILLEELLITKKNSVSVNEILEVLYNLNTSESRQARENLMKQKLSEFTGH